MHSEPTAFTRVATKVLQVLAQGSQFLRWVTPCWAPCSCGAGGDSGNGNARAKEGLERAEKQVMGLDSPPRCSSQPLGDFSSIQPCVPRGSEEAQSTTSTPRACVPTWREPELGTLLTLLLLHPCLCSHKAPHKGLSCGRNQALLVLLLVIIKILPKMSISHCHRLQHNHFILQLPGMKGLCPSSPLHHWARVKAQPRVNSGQALGESGEAENNCLN